MKDCYCKKTLFGVVYIPPDNSIYSNIDMFNDIENTLLDNDLQACLIISKVNFRVETKILVSMSEEI
jgi:hypothetical protein